MTINQLFIEGMSAQLFKTCRTKYIICFVLLFTVVGLNSQGVRDIQYLELGHVNLGYAEAKKHDEYLVRMNKNQTAIIRIKRGSFEVNREVNVLISIYSPDSVFIDEVNTADDASFIIFDSSIEGDYKVVVRRWNGAQTGKYKISLDYLNEKSSSKSEQIDSLLAQFYEIDQPGASILIQQNGNTIYRGVFGMSNLNYKIPITDSTKFDIASISKQIVAFAIAILSQEGTIDLYESIRTYIPEFPEYGNEISILQLVLNLSGIKDYQQILALTGNSGNEKDLVTAERVFDSILQFEETYFKPGTNYRYSNSGYFLLAVLIERVTGKSYSDWVRENVFLPLNMNDTYINGDVNVMPLNHSVSYKKSGLYDHVKVPLSTYTPMESNIEIYTVQTTIDNYSKWLNNYKTGTLGGVKVLSLIETGIHSDPEAWNWAFGFQKTKYRGAVQKLSTGIFQGYRAYSSYFPAEDISIIYFTNDGEWRTFYLAKKISDIILENHNYPIEKSSQYSLENDNLSSSSPKNSLDSLSVLNDSITGIYFNSKLSRTILVSVSDGLAKIKMFGHKDVKLEIDGQNVYKTNLWYMNRIVFDEDDKGSIIRCKVFNSRNGDFIQFHKMRE